MAVPVRLGVIGAGRWGRNCIRTVATLERVQLAGVASRNPATRALVPEECAVSEDWRVLLQSHALDGVVIATPPPLHAVMALHAIDAGVAVLVEKPLAMDIGEARSVRDRARQRGVVAMVEHTHLFSPAYRALKSIQPRLGAIRQIRADAGNHGPYRPDVPVLWDWGAHDVAMCLDLIGAVPLRSRATILTRRPVKTGMGETVLIELAFPAGLRAELRLSNMAARHRRFAVDCEQGSVVYDDVGLHKLVTTESGSPRVVPVAEDPPLSVAVSEFAAAIAGRSSDMSSIELGLSVVEVLAACAGNMAAGATEG
jgi:predicted dehydrogenase